MRSFVRVMLTSLVLSAGFLTAACDTFDFEIWDTKKKLPGERKPVFPEGVPGVSQGVPAEYLPGYQDPAAQPPQTDNAKAEPGAPGKPAPAAAAAKPEAKPKPQPKPKPAAQAPKKPAEQAQAPAQPQQTPAPAQPWPAPQPQAGWPSAPAPGQFSR